ncbi:LPS biosynthesis glycosyltransferase [Thermoleptolyngbya sp.]
MTCDVASPKTRLLLLKDRIQQVFIIAYREKTEPLEQALAEEGWQVKLFRNERSPTTRSYADIYCCMMNHRRAWVQAAAESQPTLIVEADFVPVVGMSALPLPMDLTQPTTGLCWLYTCAAQLYSLSLDGFAEGFSTSLVAYVVTPAVARCLCGLADWVQEHHGTGYFNFDSEVDKYLRSHGFKNYISFRNYGEHGSIPNPEHRQHGMSGIHRADVLAGSLAFRPLYAGTGPLWRSRYFWIRLKARLKGIGRLLLGRFLRPKVLRKASAPGRMLQWAIARQIVLRL